MRMALANEMTDIDLDVLQGTWSVAQYLALTAQTNRLIEYTDGVIEVLPMPTDKHQAMLEVLFLALRAHVERFGGKVRFAYQSRFQIGDPPKTCLVRVFVDVDSVPPVVVTVYRTSKVAKYWRTR